MSEYQYYEFRAIDRPLDKRAMAALRQITSRAEITPTRLINEYHYGDFKGDPDRLVDKYFDAFLYVANWGAHRLMLRLPRAAFDVKIAKPYCAADVLTARTTGEHVVLDFDCYNEDPEGWEEGEGWLDALIPLREELLAGDYRCLYLGWLAALARGEVGEEEHEPPVPAGLRRLSRPLRQLAKFLWIGRDLIRVAAKASEGEAPAGPSVEEQIAWVVSLPEAQKNELLARVVKGEGKYLANELQRRYCQEAARPAMLSRESRTARKARRTVRSLLQEQTALARKKEQGASSYADAEEDDLA